MRVLGAALALLLAACAPARPDSDRAVSFAVLGDAPYSGSEVRALDRVIDEMNGEGLAFVVHVGDITSGRGPCTDQWFVARQSQFLRIRHPFVFLPGDNDWVDCHRGGFDPLERLAKIRELFHSANTDFGQGRLRLERQATEPKFAAEYPDFRDHVRWVAAGVMFIGLNVQGSNNNLGRTAQMDEEYRRRMRAVLAWLADSLARAQSQGLAGAAVLMQADPDFQQQRRLRPGVEDGFAAIREALREHALRFGRPLLLVHGDTHIYRRDQPLSDPATGRTIENFARVVVPGSPQVAWLRGTIIPGNGKVEISFPSAVSGTAFGSGN